MAWPNNFHAIGSSRQPNSPTAVKPFSKIIVAPPERKCVSTQPSPS